MTARNEEASAAAEAEKGSAAAGTDGTSEPAGVFEAQEDARAPGASEPSDPETAPWNGPARWVVPALLAVLGAVALWGAFTVQAPPNATRPGPGAFPGAVGALLLVVAACMAAVNLRGRRDAAAGAAPAWFESRPVLIVLAALVAHVALLEVLGWLLAGALLFWAVAYAFGARAHPRDAVVSLSMSAAVQVGFSLGLGLNLPGGLLGLVL